MPTQHTLLLRFVAFGGDPPPVGTPPLGFPKPRSFEYLELVRIVVGSF